MKNVMMIILMLFSISISANEMENTHLVESMDKKYTEKLNTLIKSYDEKAFVFVEFQPQVTKVKLPLTMFESSELAFSDTGKVLMESVDVKVFMSLETLPEAFKKLSAKVLSDFKIKPNYILESLPTVKVEIKDQLISQEDSIYWSLGTALFFGFMFLFFVRSQVNQSKKLKDVLSSELKNIAENFSGPAKRDNSAEVNHRKQQQDRVDHPDHEKWSEYSTAFLTNILSDCYWCQEDEYAAFIWSQMKPKQKNVILSEVPYMVKYVNFLMSLTPVDLNMDQDPYYFNPIDIVGINNKDVAKLLEKTPGLYKQLSQMRKDHIELSIVEKIEYMHMDSKQSEKISLDSLTASAEREISFVTEFKIHSIEEEEELLSNKSFSIEVKKSIPSLGWLLELDDTKIEEILQPYNAKQLANLWIAPEYVLKKLEEKIPERKRDLLHSYLDKEKPLRNTIELKEILKQVFSEMSLSAITSSEEEEVLKVA